MDIDGSNFVRKKLVNAAVLREGRRADGVTVSQYAPYDYGYERLMLAKYVTESLSAQDRDAQIL